jgi:hypothetical protein
MGYGAIVSHMTNAIISNPPKTMVVMTCTDFQGLSVRFCSVEDCTNYNLPIEFPVKTKQSH